MADDQGHGRGRRLAVTGAVAAAYFLAAWGAKGLVHVDKPAAFWPAAGVGLGAFLISPRRLWPLIGAGVALGQVAFAVGFLPVSLPLALASAPLVAAESTLAAAVVTAGAGEQPRFCGHRSLVWFLAGVVIGPLALAVAAAGLVAAVGEGTFWSAAHRLWVGDMLGMLVVGSVLLVVPTMEPRRWTPRRKLEAAALPAVVAALTFIVFHYDTPLSYAVVPLLVFAAFRFGLPGATWAGLVMTVVAVWQTAISHGPFHSASGDPLLHLQLFLACTLLANLFLAAEISERSTTWRALERSRAQLNMLAEAGPLAFFSVTPGGVITTHDGTGLSGVGFGPGELAGRRVLEDDERHPEVVAAVKQALAGEQLRALRKWKGRYYDTLYVPHCDEKGQVTEVLGVAVDVTEREKAVRALRASEERYRVIVETADEGIWLVDAGGVITFANDRLAAMLGYRVDELVGRRALDLMSPADRERARAATRRTLESLGNHDREQGELRLRHRDGSDVWTLISGSPVLSATGEIRGGVALAVDITDRRAAEDARRALLSRLARAEEEVRQRIAGDLHDGPVQTLAAVALRLGTLRHVLGDDPLRARVEDIEASVRSTVASLRLLMFELLPPDIGEHGLVRAVRSCAQSALAEAGLAVEVSDELEGEPDIEAATAAFRIVQEALANVRAHSRASRVTITLRDDGTGFRVEIRDDGVGLDGNGSRPGHLGLRSMRARASEAGGWCRVSGNTGAGTTVTLWLPASGHEVALP